MSDPRLPLPPGLNHAPRTPPTHTVEAFCPAGVGNICVGFHLLGDVIEGPGDRYGETPLDHAMLAVADRKHYRCRALSGATRMTLRTHIPMAHVPQSMR